MLPAMPVLLTLQKILMILRRACCPADASGVNCVLQMSAVIQGRRPECVVLQAPQQQWLHCTNTHLDEQ
jgi:hypothetical protein